VSPRRLVALLIAALTLLVIGASWSAAHAQRDTTVCTAFRTRTAATGAIVTTSVAKVACGGATRVDTVLVTPTPAPVPLDPRGYNCWMARDAANPTCIDDAKAPALSQTLVLRQYGQTFGFQRWMWKGAIYPTDPSLTPSPIGSVTHDTVTAYRYWQPLVSPDSIRWQAAPASAAPPASVRTPRDTVTVPVVTPPAPSSNAPELPRASVDTRMPDMPLSGDTLYQVGGVWWCRGPTCAATRASHGLSVQLTSAPPIPSGSAWILTGKNQTAPLARPKATAPAKKKPTPLPKEPVG
jgi:hypothetical protein